MNGGFAVMAVMAGGLAWGHLAFAPLAAAREPKSARGPSGEWLAPRPPYPPEAKLRLEQGTGTLRIRTDARGRIAEAHMDPSTSSKTLDEASIAFVRAHWRGPPNQTHSTVLNYRVAPPTQKPDARTQGGACQVRVSTDAKGNVASVQVLRSAGAALDTYTKKYVRENWRGPPNSVRTVDFAYRLR